MLLKNEEVYNKDLTRKLNTSNPGSRISELRLDGWGILDKPLNFITTEKSYYLSSDYRNHLLSNERIQEFIKITERNMI